VIVFTPSSGAPIYRVAATGGEPEPVTSLEDGRFNSHRHPRFLPDGRHFFFLARSEETDRSVVMLAAVDGSGVRELLASETQAEYAAGHVLFLREETLLARPLDVDELAISGVPITVAEGVTTTPGAGLALFSVSQTGLLTLVRGERQQPIRLELWDRSGRLLERLATPRDGFRDMEFSPDGNQIAFVGLDSPHAIYLLDLERGIETRFTFGPGEEVWTTWSPDGKALYYASNPEGPHDIFRKAVGGTAREELVVHDAAAAVPVALTPDGRTLVYLRSLADLRQLWQFDLAGAEGARLFERPVFGSRAALSPDGRWLTFVALEAGRPQVFVSTFPESGRLFQVSQDGGGIPFWPAGGDEIIYLDPLGAVISVPVGAAGTTLELGAPETLFRAVPPAWGSRNFAVSPDGQRFLVARDGA
jgi:eukaryotic-like serine/threonine-protein kinase